VDRGTLPTIRSTDAMVVSVGNTQEMVVMTKIFRGTTSSDSIIGSSTESNLFYDFGIGSDRVTGGQLDDLFVLSVDQLVDRIDGGGGRDRIDYSGSKYQLNIDLGSGQVSANFGGTGTGIFSNQPNWQTAAIVSNIEDVVGSKYDDSIIGSTADNRLDGRDGNDVIHGGDGRDTLIGGGGDDQLYGDGNDDVLIAGGGTNSLYGGTGIDTADYSTAAHSVFVDLTGAFNSGEVDSQTATYVTHDTYSSIENVVGSAFVDFIQGNNGVNVLAGNGGDDHIAGLGGNDTLSGDAGNDVLSGGAGADVLDGGDGIDQAHYGDSGAKVTVNLALGTGSGGDAEGDTFISIEDVFGSAYDDTITGNSVANTIWGNAGNDTLHGGDGSDTIYGNSGNDYLFGDGGDDVLIPGSGNNQLDGGAGINTVDYSGAAHSVSVDLSGARVSGEFDPQTGNFFTHDTYTSIENVIGSAFDDVLRGDSGNNVLVGGAGADVFIGGGGIDTVDYSSASSGVKVLLNWNDGEWGDAAGDTFSGIRNITGSAYDDGLVGTERANVILGGAGNDRIDGGGGGDNLDGGDGIDTLAYIYSSAGVMVDIGTNGTNTGDQIKNFENLIGSAYNDVLIGSNDDNCISGFAGNDTLVGNGGSDTFQFLTGQLAFFGLSPGQQTVADYTVGQDKLEFVDLHGFDDLSFSQVGADTVITYQHGVPGSVTLQGVALDSLMQHASSEFIFG
jgi:Ca2+-binding RTX toxin-like protein